MFQFFPCSRENKEKMDQQNQQQQRSEKDISSTPLEWKNPLEMLAKQCDTISGGAEEERAKGRGKSGGEAGDGEQQTAATGKGGTNSSRKAAQVGPNGGTQQQNGGKTQGGGGTTHLGDGTPRMTTTAHPKAVGSKTRSPIKDTCFSLPSTAAFLPAPPPAAFLPGAAFTPPPAHLAAAMMASGFLGLPPPAPHRPPHQHFPASAIGMPNGHSPGLNSAMQQLMAAAMQQQTTQPQMVQPQILPQLFNSSAGVPLPPSLTLKKPHQLDAALPANMAMPMVPVDAFAGGPFLPPNGGSSLTNGGEGLCSTAPSSSLSIPALLMACASGQLPQGCLACTYRLKDGQLCGSVFPTEEQLFAHYKSAHIGKQSSPNVVSSTTSQGEQSTGTTTASSSTLATSAAKRGPAGSPSSSRSTPTQQTNKASHNGGRTAAATVKPHSNPGAMFCNNGTAAWPSVVGMAPGVFPPPMGPPMCLQQTPLTAQQWKESAVAGATPCQPQSAGGGAATHRYHPYAQPSGDKHQGFQIGQHQQGQNPNLQQQMAMAISNLGLMANLGALPAGFFPPAGIDFAMLAQHQLGLSSVAHPATPPATSVYHQQSQLAALAAMANSIGSNGGTSTGTTARQQQTGGVATLEAVDG